MKMASCRHWLRLFTALALMSSGAQAQTLYTCRDAAGVKHSGQFPPEQCVGEVCETNPQTGKQSCSPVREAPEEKQRRAEADARQRECSRLARQRVRDDLAFLDRWRSDEMIEEERAREAMELDRRTSESTRQLNGLKAKQKRLADEAGFYGPKHPMPATLQKEIEGNRRLIEAQEAIAASLAKAVVQLKAKYDGMLERRHRLIDKGSEPLPCSKALGQ